MSGTALSSLLTLTSSTLDQLENGDEQAAAIRRELDGRMQLAESIMSLGIWHILKNQVFDLFWLFV